MAGYHIPIDSWPMFFDRKCENGENQERDIVIDWYDDGVTESKWKWYGKKTRHEYRLTVGFSRVREPEFVGGLFVMHTTSDPDTYRACVLNTDDEIDGFLGMAGLTATDVGQLVSLALAPDACLDQRAQEILAEFLEFPVTAQMSTLAREAARVCLGLDGSDPDAAIRGWTEVEFRLFRVFEERAFIEELTVGPIGDVQRLIKVALPFVNRRKSRAGKSLEHHIAAALDAAGVAYESQVRTEGNRTMDFVFPSAAAYADPDFPDDQLVALGAKTSTKERWAQVLNEANRCETKFLLTVQPATFQTIQDMAEANLTLVVPRPYRTDFPKDARHQLLTVSDFIEHVQDRAAGPFRRPSKRPLLLASDDTAPPYDGPAPPPEEAR